MRALFDATAIPADRGGVGRYVDELLPALASQGVELVVACQPRDAELLGDLVPTATVLTAPGRVSGRAARMVWEQTSLPALARRVGADLVHSPHYTMPVRSPVPVVVTVHDATFFSHPELHLPVKVAFFRAATRVAARRAAALVAPSCATRDEVVGYTGADPRRFHVAYHGVDREVFHPVAHDEVERVRSGLGIAAGEGYIAFLGTLEPRKNLPALVRAWVRVSEGRDRPPQLLLAGANGWDRALDEQLAAVPSNLVVRRTGYLRLADLAGYLAGAEVVAYPSLGEGFGLPVLEAMACGAAVLTSRELALPEVGGDAVAYCGTSDEEIAGELGSLLDSAPRRAELARAALDRAATFTWERSARDHIAAYEAALGAR